MGKMFNHSIASVSWIDAKTGLPEIDKISYVYDKSMRSHLTGNDGYRFCNFVDVFIELAPDNRTIVRSGFYPESGIYRGPSFAGIRSHAFQTKQFITRGADFVVFRQITGARTVSPEVIGESAGAGIGTGGGIIGGFLIGGPIGAVIGGVAGGVAGYFGGQTAAHQITGFPPIWSVLEIRLTNTGYPEGKLIQHSIFPSLTFYQQTDTTLMRGENYARAFYYDARKEVELPKWKENGWGQVQSTNSPSGGNPWGIQKGIRGADEDDPN